MPRKSTSAAQAAKSADAMNITEAEVEAMSTAEIVTLIRSLAAGNTSQSEPKRKKGWIDWSPGNEPPDADAMIRIRTRKGIKIGPRRADSFAWDVSGGPEDIMAYEVAE